MDLCSGTGHRHCPGFLPTLRNTALEQIMKDKRKALVVFSRITAFSIIILALNIFYPGLKFLGGKIF